MTLTNTKIMSAKWQHFSSYVRRGSNAVLHMNQTHSICPTKMRKKSGSAFFTKLVWLNEVGPTIKPKGFIVA